MEDLMHLDLYELIGTVKVATVKEIKTAYRKKALSCHPDKNPDNPRAAEIFHELSRALEILIDTNARAAYDKVLEARHQAKVRASKLDAKRRKLKDDLEAREEAYRSSQGVSGKTDEQKLKAEIERLQKEGSKQVEEEVEAVRRHIHEQFHGKERQNTKSSGDARVKIKWKVAKDDSENGGYSYDILHQILSKHGDIVVLVVSANKKGRALVEYKEISDARTATLIEIGLVKNPLTLTSLWEDDKKPKKVQANQSANSHFPSGLFPSTNSMKNNGNTFPSFSSAPNIFGTPRYMTDTEFESSVLTNMRRAEERKKLIEKLHAEEKDS